MHPSGGDGTQRTAVRVLSVPIEQPIIVRHLGPLRGLLLHWHSGRSKPCEGVDCCPTAIHRSRTIWRAYGCVEGWNAIARVWTPAVLELTSSGEEFVRGRDLRGEVWLWDREGERSKRAPVVGVLCERTNPAAVRAQWDIEPILLRFFNVRSIRLDVPNPTPPKVFLESVAGEPPALPPDLLAPEARTLTPAEIRESIRKARDVVRGKPHSGEPSTNGRTHE